MRKVLCLLMVMGLFCGCIATTKEVKRAEAKKEEGSRISLPPQKAVKPRQVPKLPPPPEPVLSLKRPEDYGLDVSVSVSVKDASLKELLMTMARQAGVNIVVDDDIEDRRVSVTLKDVPLWQALKAVLEAQRLYFRPYPGYIRISRMTTRFFHIDYVVSSRGGASSTSVVLVSGGTEGSGATSSNVASSEEINFWQSFEERLKELMKDPLYEILQAEYRRRQLQKDLSLLPYEEDYEKEMKEHRLRMFRLKSEILEKQLEMGMVEEGKLGALGAAEGAVAEETEAAEAAARAEEEEGILGSYTIDPQTGTVVVTTTPEVMRRVERFIAEVREELKRQVLIDVQILEVALSEEEALGIDWSGFPGTIQFFRLPDLEPAVEASIGAAGGGGGGGGAAGGIVSPLATPPFSFSPTGGLQLGVLNMLDEDWAYQHTINALISFLKQKGQVKAIARPQLVTMNNQPAIVSVGVNDFYVTYELTTTAAEGGVSTTAVTSKLNPIFIGVTLHITPQISPTGEVILKIVPAINRKVGEKTVPTGIPSAPTQVIPIIETRQTSTVVRVRDGQIVILSGLIQEKDEGVTRKVPGLGEVPILGGLFRHKTKGKVRSELVIIVTPKLREPFRPEEELGYKRIGRLGCTSGSSA